MKHILVLMSLVSVSFFADADWVQVTGKAPYNESSYEFSREMAREDAFKKAVMQFGTRVMSEQRMKNGVITHDEVSLTSQARVGRSRIQEEYIWKGNLHLLMEVEVETAPVCPASQANGYKKKVAVLGFSIQMPSQTRLGHLANIDRGLASELSDALGQHGNLVVYKNSHELIYPEMINAPTHYNAQHTLTKAADFAKDIGVQFVVSGVVRDLSVQNKEAFSNSYWTRLTRFSNHANQNRRFVLDLFVHDGFSGAIVWQKQFSTEAKWDIDPERKVGFGSAEFWQDEYGKAVSTLVKEMAYRIDEQLRCQPFMTRISRVDGKILHFASGASTGVRPGDKLALYRTYHFHDADLIKGVELTNVKTALTVSQVHPDFASGTINVDPGRLNIQEDDLLIAW